MPKPFRYRIASFDTDVPPGPVGIADLPAGEEIAQQLRDVLQDDGYEIVEFDLLENYAWWIGFKVNKSRVDVELHGARDDMPWMMFVLGSYGCLFWFRTKPADLVAAYGAVDAALRKVNLVHNVRWHEEGPSFATLGASRPHPE
jgi:hypothetical protein